MSFKKFLFSVIFTAFIASALAQTSISVTYEITTTAELGAVYTCVINDVNYLDGPITIAGEHSVGMSNSDVLAILFQTGVLNEIPNNLFSEFANAMMLIVGPNLSLNIINQNSFIGATNLRHVEITGNSITSLSAGTFSESRRIETINLSNNQISFVASSTFTGLLFLRKINLADNLISSIDSTLNTLINVADLDLSNNKMDFITPLAFGGMISLRTLNLADNSIVYLHPDAFSMIYSLETLNLDNNSVVTVAAGLFGRNFALIHLSLKNTKINAIESSFLENLVQINFLDLTGNECVDQTIIIDKDQMGEAYTILARCFENFDFDPNLTSTLMTTTDEPTQPTETEPTTLSTGSPVETTTNGAIHTTLVNFWIFVSVVIFSMYQKL